VALESSEMLSNEPERLAIVCIKRGSSSSFFIWARS